MVRRKSPPEVAEETLSLRTRDVENYHAKERLGKIREEKNKTSSADCADYTDFLQER
jgi:hypothetical protein